MNIWKSKHSHAKKTENNICIIENLNTFVEDLAIEFEILSLVINFLQLYVANEVWFR